MIFSLSARRSKLARNRFYQSCGLEKPRRSSEEIKMKETLLRDVYEKHQSRFDKFRNFWPHLWSTELQNHPNVTRWSDERGNSAPCRPLTCLSAEKKNGWCNHCDPQKVSGAFFINDLKNKNNNNHNKKNSTFAIRLSQTSASII